MLCGEQSLGDVGEVRQPSVARIVGDECHEDVGSVDREPSGGEQNEKNGGYDHGPAELGSRASSPTDEVIPADEE